MFRSLIVLLIASFPLMAADWWGKSVEDALTKAKDNRAELEKALNGVPKEQRAGMAFLVENMPDADLKSLKADFLVTNATLAYKARDTMPWGKDISDDLFFNDVLPYANVDEKRDEWRMEFFELCVPIVKGCKTPTEATMKLNAELFNQLKVKYSKDRKAANQSPAESKASGTASCTGLSIILVDACRSVGIPARLAGTPNWADKRGNHTWAEVWDTNWHFTGACEPEPAGLDRGWFVGAAAEAKKDVPEHAIYAVSFKKNKQHFPLVWDAKNTNVPGENVTDRYAKPAAKADVFRLRVKVIDVGGKRVAKAVTLSGAKELKGTSTDETADNNNVLSFDLPPDAEFALTVGTETQTVKAGKAGEVRQVEMKIK